MRKAIGTIGMAVAIASVVTACTGDLGPVLPEFKQPSRALACGGGGTNAASPTDSMIAGGLRMGEVAAGAPGTAPVNPVVSALSSASCCGGVEAASPTDSTLVASVVQQAPVASDAHRVGIRVALSDSWSCCFDSNYEAEGCNGAECHNGGWIGNPNCDPHDCNNYIGGCNSGGGGGGYTPTAHYDTVETIGIAESDADPNINAPEPVNVAGFVLPKTYHKDVFAIDFTDQNNDLHIFTVYDGFFTRTGGRAVDNDYAGWQTNYFLATYASINPSVPNERLLWANRIPVESRIPLAGRNSTSQIFFQYNKVYGKFIRYLGTW